MPKQIKSTATAKGGTKRPPSAAPCMSRAAAKRLSQRAGALYMAKGFTAPLKMYGDQHMAKVIKLSIEYARYRKAKTVQLDDLKKAQAFLGRPALA